jgi:hypothetical protein
MHETSGTRRPGLWPALSGCFAWVVAMGCAGGGSGTDSWGLGEVRSERGSDLEASSQRSEGGTYLFHVATPVGVDRARLALSARKSLTVGEAVRIVEADQGPLSTVSGLDAVNIQASSQVGHVYARTAMSLGAGAIVHGYIKTAARVAFGDDAEVAVGILEGVEVGVVDYLWSTTFPNQAEPPVKSVGSEILDLRPGVYSELTVGEGSRAIIHSGEYFFDDLTVEPEATLAVDNASGPVYVWVRRSMKMAGVMRHDSVIPRVFFGYAGTVPPLITSGFRGTLVAPWSTIVLPRAEAPNYGSFFAESIDVGAGAEVVHAGFFPFAAPDYDPVLNPSPGASWGVP